MKRKMAQALCRGLWHYLPTWQVLWSLDLAIPRLSIFLTVTSAHIVNENVQGYLLWRSLDRTQIKHGIFTKSILCSCKKIMSNFSALMYRGIWAVLLSRENSMQNSIRRGLHFCVIKWGGWVIVYSICVCKKTCWKGKYANKPKVVQRVGSERG